MTDLQQLADRMEIAELVSRLGRWLDEKRFDEAATIFTSDAEVDTPGGQAKGRDAIVAQASRNHQPDLELQHLIGRTIVDLHGDRAEVDATALVVFGEPERERPELNGAHYQLDVERTADGWRISRLRIRRLWVA